jgi:hypothetical protein
MTPFVFTCSGRADRPAAFIGGTYGNVPALIACLADARGQGADLVGFLGDSIGCCGHSDQIVDLLRRNCSVAIAGNHDQEAARGSSVCGCGYSDAEDERLSCLAHAYAMGSLSEDRRRWLAGLPDLGILDTGAGRLLLAHGSPERTNEFLYESEIDEARLTAWLDRHGCDGLIVTHTGLPWIRSLADGRFAANCGAVGKPDHDGDAAVHYALVRRVAGQWRAEIRRVSYDHQAWARRLESEGVERIFIEPLISGIWTTGIASLPLAERGRHSYA